jgi:hypothetical protein
LARDERAERQWSSKLLFQHVFILGRDGIEPSTSGLKVRCSTD